jgi:hypothetical protein
MFALSLAALFAAAPAAPACGPINGLDGLLDRPGLNFLLIGEYHGTVEMPKVASDALCAAANDRPVVLGIEFPAANQPYLDAYLDSDGGEAARAALLAAPAWKEEGGRSTSAIADMIEHARQLAKAGRRVSIVAFDWDGPPSVSKEREEKLAASLRAAQARLPSSIVVALTGAGHADKEGWTSQTPPFLAAGGLLPQDATVSLAFARPGGQFWGCSAPNGGPPRGCTAYDMPPREPVQPRGIRLDPKLRGGFDGLYDAGNAYTASKPAVTSKP